MGPRTDMARSGAHPTSYSMGTGSSSSAGKRQGREVNHSSPSSSEVNNEWSYTSAPPIRLHGVDRDFTFTFTININRQVCSGIILKVKLDGLAKIGP